MKLGVVFDLDDTLYSERSYNFSGFRAVGEFVQREHGCAGFADACIALFNDGARSDMFDHAARRLGLVLPTPDLVAVYREHTPSIALFDDALAVLQQLSGRFALGLITDGYAKVQRSKVLALGLEPLFQSIVYSDELGPGAWKPSPLPYLRTVDNLAGQADHFVYIGDNPSKDFVTARRLGWHTIRMERPEQVHRHTHWPPDHEADMILTSLHDIPWNQLGTRT